MAEGSSGGGAPVTIPGPAVEGASGDLTVGLGFTKVLFAGGNTSYDTFDEEGEGEGEMMEGDCRDNGR